MDAIAAAERVLREEGGPLHYREITERALRRGYWTSEGKTPEATLNSRIAVDLQERGEESRFVRVAPGTFVLKNTRRRERPAPQRESVPARGAAQDNSARKLGVQELRDLGRQLVRESPDGIRYGELITVILDRYPSTPRNTVQGSIWNLDVQFPDEIHKPTRGLFKPGPAVPVLEVTPIEPRSSERPREEAFYEPFADWLKNDAGDATDAMPLGGAGLRSKWGTPDVIGVYKPVPSDRIKFPMEIISAEIKVDPAAPVVAFGQAVAYRLFSTKTYIAMPRTMSTEDRDRLEALCMLFGVGLVVFTPNPLQPDFAIRMRAQRFSPDMYFVNEFADGLHRLNKDTFNRLFQ